MVVIDAVTKDERIAATQKVSDAVNVYANVRLTFIHAELDLRLNIPAVG